MADIDGASGRVSRTFERRRRSVPLFEIAVFLLVALAVLGFGWLLGDLLVRGLPGLGVDFLFDEPRRAGRAGGIAPVIVSTGAVLLVCFAVAGPLGLGTGILLAEVVRQGDRRARLVRRSLDTLAGVPSVVFGLFGNAVFTGLFGLGYSILAGGLTLACMVLPFLVRSVEQALVTVPREIRQAARAISLSQTTVLVRVLFPAAMPGLVSGLLLGIGRAAGETAALLFTSGYALRMPESLADGGRVLSIHIFDLSLNVAGGAANAARSAVVLMLLLVVINACFVVLQSRTVARRSTWE